MSKIWAIAKKEFKEFFVSPIAYVVVALVCVISGYFFVIILFHTQEASLRWTLGNIELVFLFLSPLITMRVFAEEKKLGTYELLLTSPIKPSELVLGKFLGCLFLFLVIVGILWEYPIILWRIGNPDWSRILAGYSGLFLLGISCFSIGIFASALTENQIIAAVVSFSILLLLWVIEWVSGLGGPVISKICTSISILGKMDSFNKGVIDITNVVFYLSFIFVWLFLTERVVEAQRWK